MTTISHRNLFGLTILIVAAACVGDGGLGPLAFDHAVVTPACGPADGPAVAFLLASHPVDSPSPAMPYIRITVWDAPATVAGRTWRLGGSGDTASAVLVRGVNDYVVATGGQVSVGTIDTASTTQGSAVLLFPNVARVSGAFRATWSPASTGSPMCG